MAKYRIEASASFTQEYLHWLETDQRIATRIDRLLAAVEQDPFGGIGKPELLRFGKLKGCWSRRITREHRLVYWVARDSVTFLQCRYHYGE